MIFSMEKLSPVPPCMWPFWGRCAATIMPQGLFRRIIKEAWNMPNSRGSYVELKDTDLTGVAVYPQMTATIRNYQNFSSSQKSCCERINVGNTLCQNHEVSKLLKRGRKRKDMFAISNLRNAGMPESHSTWESILCSVRMILYRQLGRGCFFLRLWPRFAHSIPEPFPTPRGLLSSLDSSRSRGRIFVLLEIFTNANRFQTVSSVRYDHKLSY